MFNIRLVSQKISKVAQRELLFERFVSIEDRMFAVDGRHEDMVPNLEHGLISSNSKQLCNKDRFAKCCKATCGSYWKTNILSYSMLWQLLVEGRPEISA